MVTAGIEEENGSHQFGSHQKGCGTELREELFGFWLNSNICFGVGMCGDVGR